MDSDFNTRPARDSTPASHPRRIRHRRRHPTLTTRQLLLALCCALLLFTIALTTRLVADHPSLSNLLPGASADGWLLPVAGVAVSYIARSRLGIWAWPAAMAGLILGDLFPSGSADFNNSAGLGLLTSPAALTALALPVLLGVSGRPVLGRLRLNSSPGAQRQSTWWSWCGPTLLAGLVAPLAALGLVTLLLLVLAPDLPTPVSLAAGWALGGLAACVLLMTPVAEIRHGLQRPRSGLRTSLQTSIVMLAALAALGAVVLQSPALGTLEKSMVQVQTSTPSTATPLAPYLLLLPHLLLAMLALQIAARQVAALNLLLMLTAAALLPASLPHALAGVGLALLPLLAAIRQARSMAGVPAWLPALDDQGLALAEWHWPGGLQYASPGWLTLTSDGTVEEARAANASPMSWLPRIHPRDRDSVRQTLRRLLATAEGPAAGLNLRLAPRGGDWRHFHLSMRVTTRDRQGRARSVVATLLDSSWRHIAEDRERMAVALFEQIDGGIAVIDGQNRVVEANPAYCTLMRQTRERLIGRIAAPLSAASLEHNGYTAAQLQAPLKLGQIWCGELEITLADGTRLTLAARLGAVPAGEGSPHWRVLSLSDLSESRELQEHLQRARRFDAATGLPNREEFMRLLQQALTRASRDGLMLVVAVVDLDGFGRINADHGQLAADAVLKELSARLQSALRSGSTRNRQAADQIARLHGDEFAVLLHVQAPEEGQRAVDRLLALLSTPVAVRESQVTPAPALEISASLGATLFPFDNADPETLLRHASHALYRAKQSGPGGCHFHDPTLQQRDEAGLIALARLQRALDSGELLLHYQPQIDMQTGQVMGVEALLRWQHPERGLLAPAHFLPQVGDSGLAVQIGDWVIEQALTQAARWAQAGLNLGQLGWSALPVCVNVSVRQLQRHDFPQRLQELVQRHPPQMAGLLHLDILESDALVETTATQALIQRCQLLGVGVALDDFGASYSRLAALKRLPVDTLKLDRSYVQGMLGDAQDLSLVESVIQLARNIGCTVLAKGVESRAHARALIRLGCRLGQGNGIAAAMPPETLPNWLDSFASSDWPGRLHIPPQPSQPTQPSTP